MNPALTANPKYAPVEVPSWVKQAKGIAAKDKRDQPWKKMFPNTAPIDLATEEPEYIILTLENNVQENGRAP